MLTLNDKINNRHRIVINYNGGTLEGFSNFLRHRALFFFYYMGTSYFYCNGYIAFYNETEKSFGISITFSNSHVKNAFNSIKHLTFKY
jgi:hypothetical protein